MDPAGSGSEPDLIPDPIRLKFVQLLRELHFFFTLNISGMRNKNAQRSKKDISFPQPGKFIGGLGTTYKITLDLCIYFV